MDVADCEIKTVNTYLDCFIAFLWYMSSHGFFSLSWEPLELEASGFMNSVSAGFQPAYSGMLP